MTPFSRRELLLAGGAGLAAGAGCSTLGATEPGRWTYDAGFGRVGTPAVGDGVVYAGAEDKAVHAVDAASGERLWRYETGGPCDRPVAVDDSGDGPLAYVESEDGTLYALQGGETRWRFETQRVGEPPAPVDETVYLPDRAYVDGRDRGRLHALDAATGERRWTFRARREHVHLSSVAGDTVVCQGRGTGPGTEGRGSRLYALDAADGSERWATEPGEAFVADAGSGVVAAFVRRREVSDDGRDVAADRLRAFDLDSGTRKWSRTVETDGTEAIRVTGGTVYYGVDGAFLARDAATGERRWRVDGYSGHDGDSFAVAGGPGSAGGSSGAPVGTVYLATRDDSEDRSSVLAVDAADGTTRWRGTVGNDRGIERVSVAGETVYGTTVGSSWKLVAMDAATGERRRSHSLGTGGEWTATPDGVYLGTDDGSLVAFG